MTVMLGVLGGGQLGNYFVLAAKNMGYKTAVLDPDPHAPAGVNADIHIVAPFDDIDALRDVPVGAEVTTSGIELSSALRSAFPRGLSIGRVVTVSDPSGAVIKSAEVKPILELDSARTLLVILNYGGGLQLPSAAP